MPSAPPRFYSVEDFLERIDARLRALEAKPETQQRYGGLLTALRQHVDARGPRPARGQ